ncbi:hemerythrin domain-containing protein [Allostreptomyces psammosilenae]|uniref:Hemerythrin superfamily protein n=1 Tax=Allostreptomyces psammosilenae TaxID=1892865 RepID=A0A853A3K1_9ACTN|nr:hemerythrin domain-containing protein [Allostreptomyces psammosilenae]NYI05281.1 hemerythrin superfamily protein [Allostreptomyces psammosilenae]
MAKDVIDLITADHRVIEKLFDKLKSGKGDRSALVEEVGRLLVAHSKAEEERVYPIVAKAAPDEKGQVRHSEEEHAEAEQLVERLRGTDPGAKEFDTLVEQLVDAVTHHVQTEETEVLPALREAVDRDRLLDLGSQFDSRRRQVLQEFEQGGADEEGMSREELYQKAREEDVPGRSRMKKDELAEALRELHHKH